jgi:regulatory protein
LGRRGYEEPEIDVAVARLVERGYLDDRAFAESHVRRRSGTRGPLALSAELAARGVKPDIARTAVARLSPEAQLSAAIQLVRRQSGRKEPAGYKELLDSAGAKLLRRGFSPSVAREACLAVWRGTDEHLDP